MEPIQFNCPLCHKKLKTSDESILGRQIRCPKCGASVPVPPPVEDDIASVLMDQDPELETITEAPTAVLTPDELDEMESQHDALLTEGTGGKKARTETDDHENTELLLGDVGESEKKGGTKSGLDDESAHTELDILEKKDKA